LLSQQNGQASGGSNGIPTKLAPRRIPIPCHQSQIKNLLKKGEKGTRGGTRPKPSKNKAETEKQ